MELSGEAAVPATAPSVPEPTIDTPMDTAAGTQGVPDADTPVDVAAHGAGAIEPAPSPPATSVAAPAPAAAPATPQSITPLPAPPPPMAFVGSLTPGLGPVAHPPVSQQQPLLQHPQQQHARAHAIVRKQQASREQQKR